MNISLPLKILLLLTLCLSIGVSTKNIDNNYQKAVEQGRYARADRLLPDLEYLITIQDQPDSVDQRQIARAIKYYEFIISFNPNDLGAYTVLGMCYYRAGMTARAIRTYQKVTELNPSFFWSYYNLGMIYFWEGKFELSAQELNKALTADPDATLNSVTGSKTYVQLVLAGQWGPLALPASLGLGHTAAKKYLEEALNAQTAMNSVNGFMKEYSQEIRKQPIPLRFF